MSFRSRTIALIIAVAGFGLLGLAATPSQAQQAVNVPVGDFYFCNDSFQGGVCETTIDVGDTIVWDFSGAGFPHTTTECGADCDDPTGSPLWDSGTISDASSFQFTFTEEGTFLYRCNIHPAQMRGRIVVEAAAAAPPTDDAPADDAPADDAPDGAEAPSDDAGGPEVIAPPAAGFGPDEGTTNGWWMAAALGAAGLTLAGIGTLAYRRNRR